MAESRSTSRSAEQTSDPLLVHTLAADKAGKNTFVLRRAESADLDGIMDIIAASRELLRRDGIPQWQDDATTPTRGEFEQSIARGETYVLVPLGGGPIAGLANLVPGPDTSYNKIYTGSWREPDEPYITIHRVAASNAYAGQHIGSRLLAALLEQSLALGYEQVRIDTHDKNGRMRHLITKAGFRYAGKILIHGDSYNSRRAYDILL
jgi:RimJ/RimL family protein N-acetyltransferase